MKRAFLLLFLPLLAIDCFAREPQKLPPGFLIYFAVLFFLQESPGVMEAAPQEELEVQEELDLRKELDWPVLSRSQELERETLFYGASLEPALPLRPDLSQDSAEEAPVRVRSSTFRLAWRGNCRH